MGAQYLTPKIKEYYKQQMTPYLTIQNGIKQSMPRYYRDKLYTQNQKKTIGIASKLYALENPQFDNASHEIQYVRKELTKRVKDNKVKRKNYK